MLRLQMMCPLISNDLWKKAQVLAASAPVDKLPYNTLLQRCGLATAPPGVDQIDPFAGLSRVDRTTVLTSAAVKKWSKLVANKCDELRIRSAQQMKGHADFWCRHLVENGLSDSQINNIAVSGRVSSVATSKKRGAGNPDPLSSLSEPGIGSADNEQYLLRSKKGLHANIMVLNTVYVNAAPLVEYINSGLDGRPKWLDLTMMDLPDAYEVMYAPSGERRTMVRSVSGDPLAAIDASYSGGFDGYSSETELLLQHQMVERILAMSDVVRIAMDTPWLLGATPVAIRNLIALGDAVEQYVAPGFLARSASDQNPLHKEASQSTQVKAGCVPDDPSTVIGMLRFLQRLTSGIKERRDRMSAKLSAAPRADRQRELFAELDTTLEQLDRMTEGDAPACPRVRHASGFPASKFELLLRHAAAVEVELANLVNGGDDGNNGDVSNGDGGGGSVDGDDVEDAVSDNSGSGSIGGVTPDVLGVAVQPAVSPALVTPTAQTTPSSIGGTTTTPTTEMYNAHAALDRIDSYIEATISHGTLAECAEAAALTELSSDGTVTKLERRDGKRTKLQPTAHAPNATTTTTTMPPRVLTYEESGGGSSDLNVAGDGASSGAPIDDVYGYPPPWTSEGSELGKGSFGYVPAEVRDQIMLYPQTKAVFGDQKFIVMFETVPQDLLKTGCSSTSVVRESVLKFTQEMAAIAIGCGGLHYRGSRLQGLNKLHWTAGVHVLATAAGKTKLDPNKVMDNYQAHYDVYQLTYSAINIVRFCEYFDRGFPGLAAMVDKDGMLCARAFLHSFEEHVAKNASLEEARLAAGARENPSAEPNETDLFGVGRIVYIIKIPGEEDQYRIRWVGYGSKDDSMEDRTTLTEGLLTDNDVDELVEEFEDRAARAAGGDHHAATEIAADAALPKLPGYDAPSARRKKKRPGKKKGKQKKGSSQTAAKTKAGGKVEAAAANGDDHPSSSAPPCGCYWILNSDPSLSMTNSKWVCYICAVEYKSLPWARKHVNKVHGDDPEQRDQMLDHIAKGPPQQPTFVNREGDVFMNGGPLSFFWTIQLPEELEAFYAYKRAVDNGNATVQDLDYRRSIAFFAATQQMNYFRVCCSEVERLHTDSEYAAFLKRVQRNPRQDGKRNDWDTLCENENERLKRKAAKTVTSHTEGNRFDDNGASVQALANSQRTKKSVSQSRVSHRDELTTSMAALVRRTGVCGRNATEPVDADRFVAIAECSEQEAVLYGLVGGTVALAAGGNPLEVVGVERGNDGSIHLRLSEWHLGAYIRSILDADNLNVDVASTAAADVIAELSTAKKLAKQKEKAEREDTASLATLLDGGTSTVTGAAVGAAAVGAAAMRAAAVTAATTTADTPGKPYIVLTVPNNYQSVVRSALCRQFEAFAVRPGNAGDDRNGDAAGSNGGSGILAPEVLARVAGASGVDETLVTAEVTKKLPNLPSERKLHGFVAYGEELLKRSSMFSHRASKYRSVYRDMALLARSVTVARANAESSTSQETEPIGSTHTLSDILRADDSLAGYLEVADEYEALAAQFAANEAVAWIGQPAGAQQRMIDEISTLMMRLDEVVLATPESLEEIRLLEAAADAVSGSAV